MCDLLHRSYNVFPDLFGIARDKGATVEDYLRWSDGSRFWDVTFICPLHDWELELMTTFMKVIYSVNIRRHALDKICWCFTKSGLFEVKSYYRELSLARMFLLLGRAFGGLNSHSRCIFLLGPRLWGRV